MKVTGITKAFSKVGRSMMRCKPIAKAVTKVNKNKPEILAVGGGICIVVAFGWAIYEAVTVKEAMTESTEKVKAVETRQEEALAAEELTEEEKTDILKAGKKELVQARVEGAWIVTKRFLGPVALLTVGLACEGKSVSTLRMRNGILIGALTKTEDLLKFYRGNVREELGEEADKKFLRGIKGEQTIEEVKKDDNGKEKTVKTTVPVVKEGSNPWRFQFNEDNFDSWQDDSDLNLFYLKCEQDWWNHEYQNNDIVNLYEILKHMRFRFDKAKAKMSKKEYREFMDFLRNYGWWKGSNGDGFVDFGIYRAINEAAVRRTSDVIFVEFNCDGCLQTM